MGLLNYPDLIRFADCNNLKTLKTDKIPHPDWFLMNGGFQCQKSSVGNAAPKWDTSIVEAGAAIIDYATAQSPNAQVIVENVVPNPRLVGLREERDEILSTTSEKH